MKWKKFDELPKRNLRAYRENTAENPDFSENRAENGALIYQSGGAFCDLRFRHARMSGVCCEIMAAYNALTISGTAADFLKLAAEFERAAIPAIPAGAFGSNPFKIGACLKAYGADFEEYRALSDFESAFAGSEGAAIFSYRFGRLGLRIHTFALQKSGEKINAYNLRSDAKAPEPVNIPQIFGGTDREFLIGYILK